MVNGKRNRSAVAIRMETTWPTTNPAGYKAQADIYDQTVQPLSEQEIERRDAWVRRSAFLNEGSDRAH